MPHTREVSFQLERFEWAGDDRLEVAGRWLGLHGRRLARPALTVETPNGRRRLQALPGGHLPSAAGERWKAAFAWPDEPVEISGAELEIARSLVVELPPPRRRRRRPAAPPPEDRLRAELAELRAQISELLAERAGPPAERRRGRGRRAGRGRGARRDRPP